MVFYDNGNRDAQDMLQRPTLTPTLILGLGGTGVGTLRAFKRRLRQAWNIPAMDEGPGIIQLLGVDTVPWTNLPGQEYLHRHEYAYIGGYNAAQVLRHLDNHPTVKSWWNWNAQEVPLGQIHSGARQIRPVGRLSFFRRYRTFWNHLQPKLSRISSVATIEDVENEGYPVVREGSIRHIYIVSSLCGGTGSGIFLDVAHRLRDYFHEQAIITGVLALPSVFIDELDSDLQKARIQANTYAALKELDFFQGGGDFEVQYPGEPTMRVSRPFDRIYLIERSNQAGEVLSSVGDVMEMVGHQIFLENVSHIGSHIWAYDVNITQERSGQGKSMLAYSSFATSSIVVPEERMREYAALKYVERMLDLGLLRELTPGDMNDLDARASVLINALDDVLHGQFTASQEGEYARTSADEEVGAGEEEEWDEALDDDIGAEDGVETSESEGAPSGGWSHESFQSLLDELKEEIQHASRRYGLHGASYFVIALQRITATRLQRSRNEEDELSERMTLLESQLRQIRDPMIINLLSFWPFDMLFTNNIKQAKQRERMILRDHLSQLDHDLRIEQIAKGVWTRLTPMLEDLADSTDGRIDEIKTARNRGLGEALRVFFQLRRQVERETVFNLSSDAVNEAYIIEDFEQKNWQLIMAQRIEESLDELIGDPNIFQINVALAERKGLLESSFAETLQLQSEIRQPDNEFVVRPLSWQDIYDHLMAHGRSTVAHSIPTDEYRFDRILTTDRSMLSERIKQLFARCHPFWRFDLDKGGFDEQDLEHTILVGLDDDVRNIKLYDQLLRDHTEFERISTGEPNRIDACRIEHGLPIAYLESMSNYHRHYEDFKSRGPLHLNSAWRMLPEIVLDSDSNANSLQLDLELTSSAIPTMNGEEVYRSVRGATARDGHDPGIQDETSSIEQPASDSEN